MHHLQLDTKIRLPWKLDDEIDPTSAKLLDIVPHHSISRSKPSPINMHHLQLDTEIRLPRKLDDEIGPTSAKLLDIVPTRRQAISPQLLL